MNSLVFEISSAALVGTGCVVCNAISKWIGTSMFRVPVILLPALMFLFLIFVYTRWWTKKTSLVFYAAFYPNLIWSTLDFITFVDLWIKPTKGFISEYMDMDNPLVHNFWMIGVVVLDAFILAAANYVVLYLIHNGRSVRNWILFISCHYGFMALIWLPTFVMFGFFKQPYNFLQLPLLPLVAATPLLVTIKEPEFLSKSRVKEMVKNSSLAGLTKYLWIFTLGVLICKILIVEDYQMGFFKSHDYTMNLLEAGRIEKLLVQIHVTWYGLLLVPSVLISLASLSGKWVPSFLWDLSVIQAGYFMAGQTILIFGSLHWEMPPELKGNAGDLFFWAINGIPIAASILQVVLLSPYVSSTQDSKKGN